MTRAEESLVDGRNIAMDLATIERICLKAADENEDHCEEYDYYPTTFLEEIKYDFEKNERTDMTQLELAELYYEIWTAEEDGEPEVLRALMAYDRRKYTRRSADLRGESEKLIEMLRESLGNGLNERIDAAQKGES